MGLLGGLGSTASMIGEQSHERVINSSSIDNHYLRRRKGSLETFNLEESDAILKLGILFHGPCLGMVGETSPPGLSPLLASQGKGVTGRSGMKTGAGLVTSSCELFRVGAIKVVTL
jgi:hypothetical protein